MEEFKIGDLVLVREIGNYIWVPYQYVTTRDGKVWFSDGTWLAESEIDMVLLSSENEYLIGTDITPTKPWEPKHGELVAVKDRGEAHWKAMVFVKKCEEGQFLCAYFDTMEENDMCPWDCCEPLHRHFNVPSNPDNE